MLVNNQPPGGVYRHNYVRLSFLVGTFILFIAYTFTNEFFGNGNFHRSSNETILAEGLVPNDITPVHWVVPSLNALNYAWQLAWLLYSFTFINRRSSIGYLYVSPNTLTPTFYLIFNLAFILPIIWVMWFQKTYLIWTWIVYLVSFLLLSLDSFIINNNLALNKKIYETDGFNRDIWFLRFFAQNGIAFFACWHAIRFILAFDTFLQIRVALSIVNAGTIGLVLAGVIAFLYFFGSNLNAALVEKCAYQFAPWIVFLFYFWGVVENNWNLTTIRRNFILAVVELLASLISAIIALILFNRRYQTSKIDSIF